MWLYKDEFREKVVAEILGQFGGEHQAERRAKEAADDIVKHVEAEIERIEEAHWYDIREAEERWAD